MAKAKSEKARKTYTRKAVSGPVKVLKKRREVFDDVAVMKLESEGDEFVGKFLSARQAKTKFGRGYVATFEDTSGERVAMFLSTSLRQSILGLSGDGEVTGTHVEPGTWLQIVRAEEVETDKGNPFVAYEVNEIESPV